MRGVAAVVGALLAGAASPMAAQVTPFPTSVRTDTVAVNGTRLFVRVGGRGPAVVLLHGFGDTGDMWAPMAAQLMRDHQVIVPDLRGMGRSDHPATGFDKKNQGRDIAELLDKLNVAKTNIVAHDIGEMVAFAFATTYPERVRRLVLIEAPLPGVGPWDKITQNPALWHFNFRGKDMERLVAGRERIYLDRFWNDFAADPGKIDDATRRHYAELYALPGGMHSAFAQFAAFDQDVRDNQAWLAAGNRLHMPINAIGGEKSFGGMTATVLRAAASDVKEGIVPGSGHWVMEENPTATIAMVRSFLDRP